MKEDENITCADYIKQNFMAACTCRLEFNLTEDFKGDVYFYYGLSNYYQNHRRYVKSRFVLQISKINMVLLNMFTSLVFPLIRPKFELPMSNFVNLHKITAILKSKIKLFFFLLSLCISYFI